MNAINLLINVLVGGVEETSLARLDIKGHYVRNVILLMFMDKDISIKKMKNASYVKTRRLG